MTEDNAALARRIYQLFNDGDLDAAVALAADDVEVQLLPFGQVFTGPEGFRSFMQGFRDAFPDIEIHLTNQVSAEGQVVNEFVWSGTHTGPLPSPGGEIPPTGKPVHGARACEVWRVTDGKLAGIVNYQDAASWLRQLGLAP